ncbi:GNAT family N-acetyltransferase [Neobacillus mesonae]|uniref:GNAT family N-acetyltransferase n=1 Tax=Neobacillus mesonae TaxID=1193713 RepID=UPI00082BF24B|nr:GNAT family N-acetyltransferase [Neobacillus mesonae]
MNQLFIRDMNEAIATEILNWKYEAPYDFYDIVFTSDALNEILENPYYAVINHTGELVGFFCIGESAQVPIGVQYGAYQENYVDIGIGMKPELTGKGKGAAFLALVINHIKEQHHTPMRLTVATFNKRAIRLYEKFGFDKVLEFNSRGIDFTTMVRDHLEYEG